MEKTSIGNIYKTSRDEPSMMFKQQKGNFKDKYGQPITDIELNASVTAMGALVAAKFTGKYGPNLNLDMITAAALGITAASAGLLYKFTKPTTTEKSKSALAQLNEINGITIKPNSILSSLFIQSKSAYIDPNDFERKALADMLRIGPILNSGDAFNEFMGKFHQKNPGSNGNINWLKVATMSNNAFLTATAIEQLPYDQDELEEAIKFAKAPLRDKQNLLIDPVANELWRQEMRMHDQVDKHIAVTNLLNQANRKKSLAVEAPVGNDKLLTAAPAIVHETAIDNAKAAANEKAVGNEDEQALLNQYGLGFMGSLVQETPKDIMDYEPVTKNRAMRPR